MTDTPPPSGQLRDDDHRPPPPAWRRLALRLTVALAKLAAGQVLGDVLRDRPW